ncbi:MAG: hypothetical protein KKH73_04140, partial [Actinobacteria bacterium]|nr:hypothetical protein [Actinomycetota bacterium]
ISYDSFLSFDGTKWKSEIMDGKVLQCISIVKDKIWTVGYVIGEISYISGVTIFKGMAEFYD